MEPVEPLQINIYQSNTYRKDLSWLHFDDAPRVQERHQVKHQQSLKSVFLAYLTIPSSMATVFHGWKSKLKRREIERGERREENVNHSILKDDFSSRTGVSTFTSISPVLLDQSNETS